MSDLKPIVRPGSRPATQAEVDAAKQAIEELKQRQAAAKAMGYR
jgi:hypothetical protein